MTNLKLMPNEVLELRRPRRRRSPLAICITISLIGLTLVWLAAWIERAS